MDAGQLLDSLRGHGLQVTLSGDAMEIGPRVALLPEVRAAVRAHKPALVSWLREEQLCVLLDRVDAAEAIHRRG